MKILAFLAAGGFTTCTLLLPWRDDLRLASLDAEELGLTGDSAGFGFPLGRFRGFESADRTRPFGLCPAIAGSTISRSRTCDEGRKGLGVGAS